MYPFVRFYSEVFNGDSHVIDFSNKRVALFGSATDPKVIKSGCAGLIDDGDDLEYKLCCGTVFWRVCTGGIVDVDVSPQHGSFWRLHFPEEISEVFKCELIRGKETGEMTYMVEINATDVSHSVVHKVTLPFSPNCGFDADMTDVSTVKDSVQKSSLEQQSFFSSLWNYFSGTSTPVRTAASEGIVICKGSAAKNCSNPCILRVDDSELVLMDQITLRELCKVALPDSSEGKMCLIKQHTCKVTKRASDRDYVDLIMTDSSNMCIFHYTVQISLNSETDDVSMTINDTQRTDLKRNERVLDFTVVDDSLWLLSGFQESTALSFIKIDSNPNVERVNIPLGLVGSRDLNYLGFSEGDDDGTGSIRIVVFGTKSVCLCVDAQLPNHPLFCVYCGIEYAASLASCSVNHFHLSPHPVKSIIENADLVRPCLRPEDWERLKRISDHQRVEVIRSVFNTIESYDELRNMIVGVDHIPHDMMPIFVSHAYYSVLQFLLFAANFLRFAYDPIDSIPLDEVKNLERNITVFYLLYHFTAEDDKERLLSLNRLQAFGNSKASLVNSDQYKLLQLFSTVFCNSDMEMKKIVCEISKGVWSQEKKDSALASLAMLVLDVDNSQIENSMIAWNEIKNMQVKAQCFDDILGWSFRKNSEDSMACFDAFLKNVDAEFIVVALQMLESFLSSRADTSAFTDMICQSVLDLHVRRELFRQAAADAWRYYTLLIAKSPQTYETLLRRAGMLSRCCAFLMQCSNKLQWFVVLPVGGMIECQHSNPSNSVFSLAGDAGRVVTFREVQTLACIERGRISLFDRCDKDTHLEEVLNADTRKILAMLLNHNLLQSAFLICASDDTVPDRWDMFCEACARCLTEPSSDIELPDDVDSLDDAVIFFTEKYMLYDSNAVPVMLRKVNDKSPDSHAVITWLNNQIRK